MPFPPGWCLNNLPRTTQFKADMNDAGDRGAASSAHELLPTLELATRIKSQSKIMSFGRRSHGLAHTHAATSTVHPGAEPERHLRTVFQKPIRNCRAILKSR